MRLRDLKTVLEMEKVSRTIVEEKLQLLHKQHGLTECALEKDNTHSAQVSQSLEWYDGGNDVVTIFSHTCLMWYPHSLLCKWFFFWMYTCSCVSSDVCCALTWSYSPGSCSAQQGMASSDIYLQEQLEAAKQMVSDLEVQLQSSQQALTRRKK